MAVDENLVRNTLLKSFGFAEFREGQEQVVQCLLADQSVLAIFPTGGGKSLCYQLPALLLDGLALVVSPLIALMKDQVDALQKRQIAAARLDSSLEFEGARKVIQDMTSGELKILYVAPERFANERFLQLLKRVPIALLAIDEAHCISEWGHNFRPDYLKLATIAKDMGIPRVLALTATATPAVRKDIMRSFAIQPEAVVMTGFYRSNLELNITTSEGDDKLDLLLQRLQQRPKAATIVYVTLQKTAEEVAQFLRNHGLPSRAYHAGMNSADRDDVQNWFMAESAPIVVATIAFGMGIDKADIRGIYHYNLPKSLENYVQEIGRAGRDGQSSVCELFATANDRLILENFVYGNTPDEEAIEGFVTELFSLPKDFDISLYAMASKYDIRQIVLQTLLTYLELAGHLQAKGTFYQEYQFKPLKSSKEILAKFDTARAKFLSDIFRLAKVGREWYTVDLLQLTERLQQPRERFVAALTFLEEKGDLILKSSGLRHAFFRKDVPREELKGIAKELSRQFLQREARDLDRLQRVLTFVENDACATAFLLNYFGDESLTECGHCNRCRGEEVMPLSWHKGLEPGPADGETLIELLRENHPALQTARQLTRFLCGLTSPATTRARLQRDQRYGRLAHLPFLTVLRWVLQENRHGNGDRAPKDN